MITLSLIIAAGVLVFTYARVTKTHGLLGNLNRGALTLVTFFFGVFAVGIPFSELPFTLWILSIVFFIHDTNSNIIGAVRDVQGDTAGGYKTTPVLYGIKNALLISVILSLLYLSLTAFTIRTTHFLRYPMYFIVLFSTGIVILGIMYFILFRSLHSLTRKQALIAHELFVGERIIFASAFLIGIISSTIIGSMVFLLSFLLTLLAQHLLREQYELT